MPVDIADFTEVAVIKDIDLSHISFRYSPAIRAIQKESLNIAVIMPDLSFEATVNPLLSPPSQISPPFSEEES